MSQVKATPPKGSSNSLARAVAKCNGFIGAAIPVAIQLMPLSGCLLDSFSSCREVLG